MLSSSSAQNLFPFFLTEFFVVDDGRRIQEKQDYPTKPEHSIKMLIFLFIFNINWLKHEVLKHQLKCQ